MATTISSLSAGTKIAIYEHDDSVAYVTGNQVALRQTASSSGTVLGSRLDSGTQVTLLSYSSEWCQVSYGGYTGYMMTKFLAATEYAIYTIVEHDYNSGKALLLRDNFWGKIRYRTSTSSNGYSGSNLDDFLRYTYYSTLPSETTQYLVSLNYPIQSTTSSSSGGTTISRTSATISAAEAGNGSSYYGSTLEYTGTVATPISGNEDSYWTREATSGTSNQAKAIDSSGSVVNKWFDGTADNQRVRPTLGVSEDQDVEYDSSLGAYVFTTSTGGGGTTSGSSIYRYEGGTLVPYHLYRYESGTLVQYNLYRYENGTLVQY